MTNVGYNNSLAWKTLKEGNSATTPALGVTSCDVVVLQPYHMYIYVHIYIYTIYAGLLRTSTYRL